ncbi:hypothetical protein [Luteimicrobium subarcticum]|uniref:hypothetical protein n=1 Tax=Luteimicrobium subarcticum TaxID=620910 RepID=UPI000C245D56|nr:hypothetical protein [Luteimicrobium subarcticum]
MPSSRVRRLTSVAVLLAGATSVLVGCGAPAPLSCAAIDAQAFSSPEQLAQASSVIVRGHVTAASTPRKNQVSGLVNETFTVAVDDTLGAPATASAGTDSAAATAAGTEPSAGAESFVVLTVLNPRCPGAGGTPTPGYQDAPLASEVPAAGTDGVFFLGEPAEAAGGLRGVLGYAVVDGDDATFAAVAGTLRGTTVPVTDLDDLSVG